MAKVEKMLENSKEMGFIKSYKALISYPIK